MMDRVTAVKARAMARVLEEKVGEEVAMFDLRRLPYVTDFFVVATGTSAPHVQAMADALEEAFPAPLHREADRKEEWVLLDYGDVVVHLFQPAARAYYALERLWGDAPIDVVPTKKARRKPSKKGKKAKGSRKTFKAKSTKRFRR